MQKCPKQEGKSQEKKQIGILSILLDVLLILCFLRID